MFIIKNNYFTLYSHNYTFYNKFSIFTHIFLIHCEIHEFINKIHEFWSNVFGFPVLKSQLSQHKTQFYTYFKRIGIFNHKYGSNNICLPFIIFVQSVIT